MWRGRAGRAAGCSWPTTSGPDAAEAVRRLRGRDRVGPPFRRPARGGPEVAAAVGIERVEAPRRPDEKVSVIQRSQCQAAADCGLRIADCGLTAKRPPGAAAFSVSRSILNPQSTIRNSLCGFRRRRHQRRPGPGGRRRRHRPGRGDGPGAAGRARRPRLRPPGPGAVAGGPGPADAPHHPAEPLVGVRTTTRWPWRPPPRACCTHSLRPPPWSSRA